MKGYPEHLCKEDVTKKVVEDMKKHLKASGCAFEEAEDKCTPSEPLGAVKPLPVEHDQELSPPEPSEMTFSHSDDFNDKDNFEDDDS